MYWLCRNRHCQNILLLVASYVFYGFVHPWFCVLLAISTVADYCCGLALVMTRRYRGVLLGVSLCFNLGLLGVFKYFNFFSANVHAALAACGLRVDCAVLDIVLPVGISFYTFQTLSYTIDIYKGILQPRRNFVDFALFVSFFPQLVAGPIERAGHFLPQIERERRWQWGQFFEAWPLLLSGYLKKLVVADNVAVYVDKVFMLDCPSLLILLVGSMGFAIQIFADFSAYTDIARGTARLLGFELIENFNAPYLSVSPSDFWRRWHLSFSSWIRDYVYIPLGGSQVESWRRFVVVVMVTMCLSGLWHGAAWHFVAWGAFHGLLLLVYHALGLGGRWVPKSKMTALIAWMVMQFLTIVGWTLFRCPNLHWLGQVVTRTEWGISGDQLVAGVIVALTVMTYTLPWMGMIFLESLSSRRYWIKTGYRWVQVAVIALLANPSPQQFIYFQF